MIHSHKNMDPTNTKFVKRKLHDDIQTLVARYKRTPKRKAKKRKTLRDKIVLDTIELYTPYIHKTAVIPKKTVEELKGAAAVGVMQALDDYRFNKKVKPGKKLAKFTTYQFMKMRKEMQVENTRDNLSGLSYANHETMLQKKNNVTRINLEGQNSDSDTDEIDYFVDKDDFAKHIEQKHFLKSLPDTTNMNEKQRKYFEYIIEYGAKAAQEMMKMKKSELYELTTSMRRKLAGIYGCKKAGLIGLIIMISCFSHLVAATDESRISTPQIQSNVQFTNRSTLDPNAPWFIYDSVADALICKGEIPAIELSIVDPQNIYLQDVVRKGERIKVPVSGSFAISYSYKDPEYGKKAVYPPPYRRVQKAVFVPPIFNVIRKGNDYHLIGTSKVPMTVTFKNVYRGNDNSIVDESQVWAYGGSQRYGTSVDFLLTSKDGSELPPIPLLVAVEYRIDDPSGPNIDTPQISFTPKQTEAAPLTAPVVINEKITPDHSSMEDLYGKLKYIYIYMFKGSGLLILIGLAILAAIGFAIIKIRASRQNALTMPIGSDVEVRQEKQREPEASSSAEPKANNSGAKLTGVIEREYCAFEYWDGRYIKQSDSVDPDVFAFKDERNTTWYLTKSIASKGGTIYKFRADEREKEGSPPACPLPEEIIGNIVVSWNQYQDMPTAADITKRHRASKHYTFKDPVNGDLYLHVTGENGKITEIKLAPEKEGSYYSMPHFYDIKRDANGNVVYGEDKMPIIEKSSTSIMKSFEAGSESNLSDEQEERLQKGDL